MKNIIDTFISLLALTAIGISVYHYLVCHPSVEEMMELMNNDIIGNYFNLDSLKTMTIEKGDLEAYYDLEKGLIHQSPTFEFDYLPYSLYMAKRRREKVWPLPLTNFKSMIPKNIPDKSAVYKNN